MRSLILRSTKRTEWSVMERWLEAGRTRERKVAGPYKAKRDARKVLEKLSLDPLLVDASTSTLADMMGDFLRMEQPRSPKGRQRNRVIQDFWIRRYGPLRISEFDAPTAKRIILDLSEGVILGIGGNPVSGATASSYRMAASKCFNWSERAERWGVRRNPFSNMFLGETGLGRARKRVITDREEKLLFEYLGTRDYGGLAALIVTRLLRETCCRESEICSLRWRENVNLSRREIQIFNTKNGDSRLVPISPVTCELLYTLHGTTAPCGTKILRMTTKKEGPVFPEYFSANGAKNYYRQFKKACREAGLEDVTVHDLRGLSVRKMIEAGCSLALIRNMGGWRTTATLIRHYAHILETQNLETGKVLFMPLVNRR